MHPLEISGCQAQRKKPEHTSADLAVMPRIGDDDNQLRRHNHVRRDAADRAFQRPKALRIGTETFDGSAEKRPADPDLHSSIVDHIPLTCSTTFAMESPGRMRKLIAAFAELGSTLSFVPAWNMVTAVVVRTIALVVGRFSRLVYHHGRSARGSRTRAAARSGTAVRCRSNSSRVGPSRRACIGLAFSLAIAALRMPTAV